MKFRTTLRQAGKTATGIMIPPEIVESFGAGKKPPVTITINGHTYRNTIAVMGGDFMVGVSAENREKANVKGGDTIEVDIELDTRPRVVEVPADLAKNLDSEPEARQFFESLPYSHKNRHIVVINDAKTPETRARRIAKAIDMLKEGKK
jgi:Bacteriocin-protection, YdeI or OmpD-Associated/Domain of unknown function (DUF1905)